MKPTEEQMRGMVDRFLAWKLPETVHPDCGTVRHSEAPIRPTDCGTNLLSAVEARAMLEHVLGPVAEHDALQERYDFLLAACRDAQDLASRYGWALHAISQGAGDRTTARQALRGTWEQVSAVRAALAELVALKAIKDALPEDPGRWSNEEADRSRDYLRRKPLAWAAAQAALGVPDAAQPKGGV